MGFLVVSAVLVVSFGRLGDMFGRVRMYNLGFAIFSVASIFLTVTWMHGADGSDVADRLAGGAGHRRRVLFANSAAIIADAFPANQRGARLSVNSIAAIAGSFIGLLQRPIVSIAATRDDGGYWLVATDGGMFAFGDARFYGSIPGLGIAPAGSTGSGPKLNAPIVGMVPSSTGNGYFLVASDGGVFAFGDAQFEGSCPGNGGCSAPVVAVQPDPSGGGYWVATSLGTVDHFGNVRAIAPGRHPRSCPLVLWTPTPQQSIALTVAVATSSMLTDMSWLVVTQSYIRVHRPRPMPWRIRQRRS